MRICGRMSMSICDYLICYTMNLKECTRSTRTYIQNTTFYTQSTHISMKANWINSAFTQISLEFKLLYTKFFKNFTILDISTWEKC